MKLREIFPVTPAPGRCPIPPEISIRFVRLSNRKRSPLRSSGAEMNARSRHWSPSSVAITRSPPQENALKPEAEKTAEANFGAEIKPEQKAGLEIDEDYVLRSDPLLDGSHGFGHIGTALVFPMSCRADAARRNLAHGNHQKGDAPRHRPILLASSTSLARG